MKGQGGQRNPSRAGRGVGSSGAGSSGAAAVSSAKASPSDKWCKDWQMWVIQHVDDNAASFNAAGEAAAVCEARLAQHISVKAVASQLGSGRSADTDLLSAASTHATSVAELAIAQLDRQALSLRSNTRKSDDAAGASAIVTNHRMALELLLTATTDGAPLTVEQLLRVHRWMMGDAPHAGKLRTTTRALIGAVVFPPADRCAELLASLVAALNALVNRKEISHLGLAAAACVGLLSIHPFHDGNGRLSRLLANAMLRRRGVPFVVSLCGTDEQRRAYVKAILSSREGRGSMAPFASLLAEQVSRVWEELDRRSARAKAARDEAAEAELMRARRERARQEGCMICLEQDCNMLTVCCGAAAHMNCMAQWLSEAATPTCCNCREVLPRPQPRPAPPAVPATAPVRAPAAAPPPDAAVDDDTTEDTTTEDDTTTADEEAVFRAELNSLIDAWQQAPAGSAVEGVQTALIVAKVREHPHRRALAAEILGMRVNLLSQINAAAGEALFAVPDADDTTTEDDTTTDDTTTADEEAVFRAELNSLIDAWMHAEAYSAVELAQVVLFVAKVREHPHRRALAAEVLGARTNLISQINAVAGEPLLTMPAPDPDDTTIEDDTTTDDTTTDDTPRSRTDARGRPMCRHCTNQPAPTCTNACCGRCCVLHGQFRCPRHS